MDDESSDEEGYTIISGARHRRSHPNRWCFDPNVDIVMPEDVTDEMLDNVVGKILGLKTRTKLYMSVLLFPKRTHSLIQFQTPQFNLSYAHQ